MNRQELRSLIVQSLEEQGFRVCGPRVLPPAPLDKDRLRTLHALAVRRRVDDARPKLARHEARLLRSFASGREVHPERISPRLVEVQAGSADELLFRYACLHWSIPVSSGYGRRLRFLVVDDQNAKLIGLLGLGDPVFSLAARDEWVGWDADTRGGRLSHVMDAFVLGAVPPYSFLLCGKLVAMLAASDEVRLALQRKYKGHRSMIRRRPLDTRLALLTTTSALGRSSVYNRLKYGQRLLYQSVGYTQGWGEFHFSNGIYHAIRDYAARWCAPSAKHNRWGTGYRNRRETVRKCLAKIGLSERWLIHGVRREVFVVPLAGNARQFLRGEHSKLMWFRYPAQELFTFFRDRWLLPRSERNASYKAWDPAMWTIWDGGDDA